MSWTCQRADRVSTTSRLGQIAALGPSQNPPRKSLASLMLLLIQVEDGVVGGTALRVEPIPAED